MATPDLRVRTVTHDPTPATDAFHRERDQTGARDVVDGEERLGELGGPRMPDDGDRRSGRAVPGLQELRELYEGAVGCKCMSCGSALGRARTFAPSVGDGDLSNLVVLCDACDEARQGCSPADPVFLNLIVTKTRRERDALGRALSPRNSRRVLDYLRMRAL